MIHIFAVSDSNKHFASAIQEYTKRLGKSVDIKYIKPSKKNTIPEIISQEGEALEKIISKIQGYSVLLYINSQTFDTLQFHKFIEGKLRTHADLIFIIGGAYGVSQEVEHMCDTKISLSAMTFPHSMALLVLLEQIYRSSTIKSGKKYHH